MKVLTTVIIFLALAVSWTLGIGFLSERDDRLLFEESFGIPLPGDAGNDLSSTRLRVVTKITQFVREFRSAQQSEEMLRSEAATQTDLRRHLEVAEAESRRTYLRLLRACKAAHAKYRVEVEGLCPTMRSS